MPRRSKEWYIAQGKPLPASFERRTYNWYVQRGLTPPSHLKVPKVIKIANGISNNPTAVAPVASAVIDFVRHAPINISSTYETDDEIENRIKTRFEVFESLVDEVIAGNIRGLIVSGPPGMGKSFPVEQKLRTVETSRIVKGHASAKGLYELLYECREQGSILVLDDADSIFGDEKALNLLKSAMDTTKERVLSWVTSSFNRNEDDVPTVFTFEGSVIFITNLDFDKIIARGNRIAKHLEAIVSRSFYIDLMMKTARDYIIRIKQVIRDTDMLNFLEYHQRHDVIKFLEDNEDSLREISLRTALRVGMLRRSNNHNWENIAKITCCK